MAVRVVLADDSADLRDVMRSSLEGAGADVVGDAASGEQALELARSLRPDVVVLDIAMPGPPAAELIAAIRRLPSAPGIVVYSGWPGAELRALGVELVAKSSDPSELLEGVRRAASNEGVSGDRTP